MSAKALAANIERNRIKGAQVATLGLSSHRGSATIYNRGPNSMNTLFTRDRCQSTFQAVATVTLITLDDVFERFDVKQCDLLKLDCEGAEYDILFAAREETLAKVRNIALEYHVGLEDYSPEELKTFLQRQGFEITRFSRSDVEGGHLHASRTY